MVRKEAKRVQADIFLVDLPQEKDDEELRKHILENLYPIRETPDESGLMQPYTPIPKLALAGARTEARLTSPFFDIRELIQGFIRNPIDLSTLADQMDELLPSAPQ